MQSTKISKNYASDNEFFSEMRYVHKSLLASGWSKGESKIFSDMVTVKYHKNGYTTYLAFGCSEKIKEEFLD